MSEIAAIIPARFASTRFPGKPLELLAGKPLVQHVWERCRRARAISRVIIATDDERIARAARAFDAEVAMTSPSHQSGTDRIAEVARKLRGVTHVINVQGDEPVVDPALINRLARTLAADSQLEMITAASALDAGAVGNPNVVKVVLDRDGHGLYFSRSPIPFVRDPGTAARFYRHHGIYGYSRAFLLRFVKWPPSSLEKAEQLEQLRALEHGTRIRVLITKTASVGVDSPDDLAEAERLLLARR